MSGVNSDSEIGTPSRYTPTSSFTPGWSRAVWPDEVPRMATWLWPGPRFWTLNPACVVAMSSMVSAPRARSSDAVGAAMEKGTSFNSCSRSVAVTVIALSGTGSSTRSTVVWASTRTSLCEVLRYPTTAAATVYAPGVSPATA